MRKWEPAQSSRSQLYNRYQPSMKEILQALLEPATLMEIAKLILQAQAKRKRT